MVNSFGASMSREQVEAAIYQQQEREEMPAKKRVEKEDSVLTAQKFFLTWLIEEPSIYDKTKDYINVMILWKHYIIMWLHLFLKN